MIKSIVLDGRIVQYELQRKAVKNVNLRIKPDLTVYLSANQRVQQATIDEFLYSKQKYILKALDYYQDLQKFQPKPKQFVDGESFAIFGHDRRLKVLSGTKNFVASDESFVYLTVKDTSNFEQKRKTMTKWLNVQCESAINRVCEQVFEKFKKYCVDYPQIKFRNMVSMWGSCQPKRKILTFNYALISVPMSSIEYVVVHEFTHFLHPNHSKKFYVQLRAFMPDWQERKSRLEKLYLIR